uniref:Uncharacterized protein n=1 Tax=Cyanoderma ruficeps TaxID=181631 RepID=A0A8C3R0J2_9PASS
EFLSVPLSCFLSLWAPFCPCGLISVPLGSFLSFWVPFCPCELNSVAALAVMCGGTHLPLGFQEGFVTWEQLFVLSVKPFLVGMLYPGESASLELGCHPWDSFCLPALCRDLTGTLYEAQNCAPGQNLKM